MKLTEAPLKVEPASRGRAQVESFAIRRSDGERPVVFHLEGEFDLFTVPHLEAALDHWPDEAQIVVDTRGLTFVDSSGLRAMLELDRARRARGRSVVWLVTPDGPVRRLMDLVGIDGDLNVREDPPD